MILGQLPALKKGGGEGKFAEAVTKRKPTHFLSTFILLLTSLLFYFEIRVQSHACIFIASRDERLKENGGRGRRGTRFYVRASSLKRHEPHSILGTHLVKKPFCDSIRSKLLSLFSFLLVLWQSFIHYAFSAWERSSGKGLLYKRVAENAEQPETNEVVNVTWGFRFSASYSNLFFSHQLLTW